MTNLDKPVVRRTPYVVHGRNVIATMTPEGLVLREERTARKYKLTWAQLYRMGEQHSIDVIIPGRRK
jgi:hypothetical protein